MIKLTVNLDKKVLERLRDALTPARVDTLVEQVGLRAYRRTVEATPKKWFGQVRRSWQFQKPREGVRVVINPNKIMLFLEEGTQAHGPVSAKALYIPLTRRAAFGHRPGMVYGRDYVLRKWVKGIEARHIAKQQAKLAQEDLLNTMKTHIRQAIGA